MMGNNNNNKKKKKKGNTNASNHQVQKPYSEFWEVLRYFGETEPSTMRKAFDHFLEQAAPDDKKIDFDSLETFISEWFIFDFKLPNGNTPLQEFILVNPYKLGSKEIFQLKQAEVSNFTAEFWVSAIDNNRHLITLEAVTSDQTYAVFDKAASKSLPSASGLLTARLIKQEGQWYLAGNPLTYIPIVPTEKMKSALKEPDSKQKTFIDLFRSLYSHKPDEANAETPFHEALQPLDEEEIKALTEKLHKEYNALRKKYSLNATWAEIKRVIKYAPFNASPLDVFKGLFTPDEEIELDLPDQETFTKIVDIFFSCWNLLPHIALGGKSPNELSRTQKEATAEGIIQALECPDDDPIVWFIDPKTMEVSFVDEVFHFLVESFSRGSLEEDLTGFQEEYPEFVDEYGLEEITKWIEEYRYRAIVIEPLKYSEKLKIMEEFIELEIDDVGIQKSLLRALQERGAFRHFRRILLESALLDDYFYFYDGKMMDFVLEWLEENGLSRP